MKDPFLKDTFADEWRRFCDADPTDDPDFADKASVPEFQDSSNSQGSLDSSTTRPADKIMAGLDDALNGDLAAVHHFNAYPVKAQLIEALRENFCPRPCNGRPDDFTVGQCVDAGECGCMNRAALAAAEAEENTNKG